MSNEETTKQWLQRRTVEWAERKRTESAVAYRRDPSLPAWFHWPERRVWSEDDATTRDPDHVDLDDAFDSLYPGTRPAGVRLHTLAIAAHDGGDGYTWLIRTACGRVVAASSAWPGNSDITELEPPPGALEKVLAEVRP